MTTLKNVTEHAKWSINDVEYIKTILKWFCGLYDKSDGN